MGFHVCRVPLLRYLFIALIAITFAGCSKNTQKVIDAHMNRAKKLYEYRDYQGAIIAYGDILRIDPNYSNAHFQMALIYDRNLTDYLNAAYHYQRFLQSANPEAGKVELAKSFFEDAKLHFAASIPNFSGQNSPELVKLRTENAALHRQIEDLKRELVQSRAKQPEPAPKIAAKPLPPTKPILKAETPKPSRPKTYTVKRGEGIQAIAEKIYGDRRKWKIIMAANPKVKDPNRLSEGQVLNLP
jgi:tetratricopeptide (TPR) repeat protein